MIFRKLHASKVAGWGYLTSHARRRGPGHPDRPGRVRPQREVCEIRMLFPQRRSYQVLPEPELVHG